MSRNTHAGNELPWTERVGMLSINPDVATIDDIAQMAAELLEAWNREGDARNERRCAMKFRKKPMEIEAVQWTGENWDEVKAFAADAVQRLITGGVVRLNTPSSARVLYRGDWIVKDVGYFDKMSAKQMHEGVDDALAADGLDCNVRPHVCGEGEKKLSEDELDVVALYFGTPIGRIQELDNKGLLNRAACRRKIEEGK